MKLSPSKRSDLVNIILVLHGLFLLLLLAYLGKLLWIPLFFSFLIAVFLYPLCRWLERHRFSRMMATLSCIFLLLLVAAVMVYFVGSQFRRFVKDLPLLRVKLMQLIREGQVWLQQHYQMGDEVQVSYVDRSMDGLIKAVGFTITGSLTVLLFITLSLFFISYMLYYRHVLKEYILSPFSAKQRAKVADITGLLNQTIIDYVKGLLTEIGVLLLLSFLTLFILGVKYALLMAFFAAVFNIIPYIGIYVAAFINMIITIVTGSGAQSIEVLLVFVVIHVVDAHLIMPVIVGQRIKVNPFITLVAVIAGELVWGIPGMFLFVPLAAILNVIIERVSGRQTPDLVAFKRSIDGKREEIK